MVADGSVLLVGLHPYLAAFFKTSSAALVSFRMAGVHAADTASTTAFQAGQQLLHLLMMATAKLPALRIPCIQQSYSHHPPFLIAGGPALVMCRSLQPFCQKLSAAHPTAITRSLSVG
jgi:hypothetical protein